MVGFPPCHPLELCGWGDRIFTGVCPGTRRSTWRWGSNVQQCEHVDVKGAVGLFTFCRAILRRGTAGHRECPLSCYKCRIVKAVFFVIVTVADTNNTNCAYLSKSPNLDVYSQVHLEISLRSVLAGRLLSLHGHLCRRARHIADGNAWAVLFIHTCICMHVIWFSKFAPSLA
jgi:hypothetical protein